MAGDYQHYLQQMLQKGFRRPEGSKRNPTVWEYRKSTPPESPRRTAKLGAEDHFYSANSNGLFKSLDDKITDWEAHRQADVRKWRSFTDGQIVEPSKAASLVGLTAVRTRSVRRVFSTLFEGFLGEFSQTVENPDVLFNHLKGQTGLLGSKVKEEMIKHLGGIPIAEESGEPMMREVDAVGRMISYSVSEHFSIELAKRFREIGNLFNDLFEEGPFDIQEIHNEALEDMLDDSSERKDLTSLHWSIRRRQTGSPWILPDCAVMSVSKDGRFSPFLFGGKDERAAMLLPLSPDCVLIGMIPDCEGIDLEELDRHAALCSSEFFVASERSKRLEELCDLIGQGHEQELAEGIQSTMTALNPFLTKPKNRVSSYKALTSLPVSGFGFEAKEDEFSSIAQIVVNMIGTASRSMHLDQITQVNICAFIPEALAHRLEVSVEELGPLDGDGAFYQVPVENDDGLGFEFFINGWALGLILHTDGDDHDYYLSLFFETLWQIHSRAILFEGATTFQETQQLYEAKDVSHQLMGLAVDAALKYVAARHAAYTGDLNEVILDALRNEFANSLVGWDAAELPLEGDQEERNATCGTLMRASEALFRSAVRYLGLCQAQNIDAIEDLRRSDELASLIEKHSLQDWIHRLDVDLLILFANFEKPFERSKVTALTDHIERLYWGRGAIIMEEGDGSRVLPFTDRQFNYAALHEEVGKYAAEFIPADFDTVVKDSVGGALSGKSGQ